MRSKPLAPVRISVLLLLTFWLSAPAHAHGDDPNRVQAWVDSVMSEMTLEEKVAHLFVTQARGEFASSDDPGYRRLVDLVENFGIGGVIFSTGTLFGQAVLTNDLQRRAEIPLVISQDMEWGVGMRIPETSTFPRAMAVGATRDPDLAYEMGRVVAQEARALGVHINYAPVADVNNNPFNPIINVRAYAEDPNLVTNIAAAYTRGMQDGGLLATAKHFPGHGDTATDSHADLPVLKFTRARLDSLELEPFRALIDAGIASVMVGHLALPELEPDARVPATLSPRIVQDILRDDLGFDGLVVTDALDMNGVTKHFGVGEAAVRTLEAGVDVLLMTRDEYAARAAILAAVEEGRLSEGRIDESLDRILSTKRTLGLTSTPQVDLDALRDRVSTLDHVALNDEIARRSLTLLSNKDTAVPLPRERSNVLVVALNDASDPDAGRYFLRQMRASAPQHSYSLARLDLSSQPQEYSRVLADASAADVIVVPAFVRVRAWSGRIDLSDMHQLFLNALMQKGAPVVLVSFGNPYLISNLDAPSAYLAAFSWSESSQRAVADALAGTSAISGRLPVNIPGTYAFGDGMSVSQRSPRMGTPREGQFSPTLSERVDSLMEASIADRAFPAAAVAIGRPDVTAHLKGYGYLTYESETPVTTHTLFDVASLTKVVATTPAIMRLVEDGKMDLNAPLATYLPEFGRNGKDKVTVRQILTHTAGLKAFYQFYDQGITDRDEIIEFIFNDSLRYEPDTRYVYSDLGMMMLALAVERVSGEAFEDFVQTHIFAPLGMSRSGFRPAGGEGTDPSVVPTEVDEAFGRGLVQGEVHDERAWMLGGVAGHAGLFSCAEDLSLFAQMLLNEGRLHGQQIFKPETVERFTARFPNAIGSDRALGWDTKSPEGYSSAGSKFGSNSFGHTGFTGTSMWMDPDADLFVILLTNRVYPTRDNKKHVPIRPAIADIAFESMIDEPWMIYR